MDIFQYPSELNRIEQALTSLRNEKDRLEREFRDKKASLVALTVDIVTYKSSAIRENFIIFQLANNIECVKIEDRLLQIQAELREKSDEHAELRRQLRLLEVEYNAHGIRDFTGCGKYEIKI